MEVHFQPDLQAKLDRLSVETGRAKDELVQDARAPENLQTYPKDVREAYKKA